MADLAELLRSGDKNAVVSDIYQNVLGRQADPSAYAWANNLDVDDPNSILNLSRRIAQSEEGKNYAKGNQGQYNYIAGLSQSNNPFQNPMYSNMEYLGNYNYKDPSGGVVIADEMGNPVSYAPGVSWYDQQLAKHPNALRGSDYRNQVYLAGGPLDQTYNFNGQNIPIQAVEYQVDPKTGKFITDQNGNYKPVELRPQGYNMWDDWAAPVAAIAIPALAAGGAYLAGAYGAGAAGAGAAEGAGALTTTEMMGGAGGAFTPAAGSGASFAIPAGSYTAAGVGAAGSGSWGLTPELAAELGLDYSTSGLTTDGVLGSQALEAMGLNTASGFGVKDAYNAYKIANALKNLGAGSKQVAGGYSYPSGTGTTSGISGMQAYQRQNPYLSTAQQNTVPDATTEALTKLLRGYNG